MKKILIGLMVFFLSACTLMGAVTPKQKVSEFLDKYKNQDSEILTQLDETINSEYTNDDYRSRYRTLMTNQYKNLDYKIKDEIIEDDNAVVEAEITVYDYASAIRNSNDYLNTNPNESVLDNNDTETKKDDNMTTYDEDKFIDYRLKQMENISDTVTYTIEFTLTKVNGEWQMDALSNADIEKIHGIYNQ